MRKNTKGVRTKTEHNKINWIVLKYNNNYYIPY